MTLSSRRAWIAAVIAIGVVLLATSAHLFPDQLGYDLYHPWGIGTVHAELPGLNPYANTREYGDAMAAHAKSAASAKARFASAFWYVRTGEHIEPTGTPLYYAALRVLPENYDHAHLAFACLQFVFVALGVVLLARLRGVGLLPALAAAFAIELLYNPFIQDVKMANANALQFGVIAMMVYASASGFLRRHRRADLAFLPLLAMMLVFKPNIVFVAAALAAHYVATRPLRVVAQGSALAMAVALLGIWAGAAYFGSLAAWGDWLHYVSGTTGKGSLLYSLDGGNQSIAMLLAEKTGGYSPYTYAALLAGAMGVALVVAASDSGKRPELLLPTARRVLDDAWLCASIGVVMACACAPLVWPHYFLLNLLPIGWLLRDRRRWDFGSTCAVISFAMQSKPLILALGALHWTGLLHVAMFYTWVPLVPALLLAVVQRRAGQDMATAAQPG